MRPRTKIGVGLFAAVCVLAIANTALRARHVSDAAQNQDRHLPIVVKEFRQEDGTLPVSVLCSLARISGASTLSGFTCRFINNTPKKILAASINYSVSFEEGGKTSVDKRVHTLETVIHSDFFDDNKAILSGAERIIQPPGPMSYGNAVITGLEMEIDYVEFEDKSTLGANVTGGQIIKDIREGAIKYKEWLIQTFKERGRDVQAIAPLLRKDQPLPVGLEGTAYEQGARAYRNRLLRVYEVDGAAQVSRRLNR